MSLVYSQFVLPRNDKDLFQIRLEALKISLNLTALLSGVSAHDAHLANYRVLRQRIHKGFDVLNKHLKWTLFDKIVLTSQIIAGMRLEHLVLEKLKYVYNLLHNLMINLQYLPHQNVPVIGE